MSRLKIFISYRRSDFHGLSQAIVSRIFEALVRHYGGPHVFMDIDNIPPGADFVAYIESWVAKADVLLAVIGPQWLDLLQERREDPRDFVRIEIEAALRRGIPVVPVVMGGATMPKAAAMPAGLADLATRNAVTLDHGKDFNSHIERLIRDLDEHYGGELPPDGPAAVPDSPLINTLGMPFVRVPGLDVRFGQWPVRVQDYAKFASETSGVDGSWKNVEYQGHKQGPDHPVVNVNWEEAKAFCAWLSRKEGKTYRLPTDYEWSVAAGIGDSEDPKASPKAKHGKLQGVYPWGTTWPPPPGAGNYAGEAAKEFGFTVIDGYRDGHPFTSPVGSYAANLFGIHDLGGNVWEWCEDRYEPTSSSRVLRGASWLSSYPDLLLSSYRYYIDPSSRFHSLGYRVVLEGVGER